MVYDVAIVGGGPAGTAAALTLLQHTSLNVVVFERTDYSGLRIGETVPMSLGPLLTYLGVWKRFVNEQHLQSYSTAAAWGEPEPSALDFRFSGYGIGWHIDRQRFDVMMAEEVERSGGRLERNTTVVRATREEDAWLLKAIQHNGEELQVRARYVIDASGREATIARQLGADLRVFDRLTSVMGCFTFEDSIERPPYTLIEACPSGWWYSALLPGQRIVAAWMSDSDLIEAGREQSLDGWLARLSEAPYTKARLAGARFDGLLAPQALGSQSLNTAVGDGWVAAGDAASVFDPLSSMGLGHAISSGVHAARVADAALDGDETVGDEYNASIDRIVETYTELCQRHYSYEQRWQNQPFWARRHATIALEYAA